MVHHLLLESMELFYFKWGMARHHVILQVSYFKDLAAYIPRVLRRQKRERKRRNRSHAAHPGRPLLQGIFVPANGSSPFVEYLTHQHSWP